MLAAFPSDLIPPSKLLGEVVVFSHHQQTQEKRISSQRGHFSASLKPNDSWILPPPASMSICDSFMLMDSLEDN